MHTGDGFPKLHLCDAFLLFFVSKHWESAAVRNCVGHERITPFCTSRDRVALLWPYFALYN